MKNHLKTSLGLVLILAGSAGFSPARAADGEVASPTKRQEVLDQAKKTIAGPESLPVGADPFHSVAFRDLMAGPDHSAANDNGDAGTPAAATPAPVKAAGPRSTREILRAIAAGLTPNGFFQMGTRASLVFGQKLVRAGDFLTVTFEGTDYNVEISSIDLPNFTLRLNREEFTRPIKQGP